MYCTILRSDPNTYLFERVDQFLLGFGRLHCGSAPGLLEREASGKTTMLFQSCDHPVLLRGHWRLLRSFFRQELHVERARGQTRSVEAIAHVGRDVVLVGR